MSREDQNRVTVFIDFPGLGDMGVWENLDGRSGDSDSTKHREGGMGQEISYGGPQTFENATCERRFDVVRDGAKLKAMFAARGRARCTIVEQPLDEFGVAFGEPTSWGGRLKSVNPGTVNANSGDIRMVAIEQDTDTIS